MSYKRVMNIKDAVSYYKMVRCNGCLSDTEERFMEGIDKKLRGCALARQIPRAHQKRVIEIGEKCRLWLIDNS